MWRCEPVSTGVGPQVAPRIAQEVAPPPRPRAEHAPRREDITQAMLEERGYTAGRLKRNRVRERRPAAGTCHSEECRARFKTLLRPIGGASMARADARVNEHLA
eukprot:2072462-Alexandrium_andersonii.AAC.1